MRIFCSAPGPTPPLKFSWCVYKSFRSYDFILSSVTNPSSMLTKIFKFFIITIERDYNISKCLFTKECNFFASRKICWGAITVLLIKLVLRRFIFFSVTYSSLMIFLQFFWNSCFNFHFFSFLFTKFFGKKFFKMIFIL